MEENIKVKGCNLEIKLESNDNFKESCLEKLKKISDEGCSSWDIEAKEPIYSLVEFKEKSYLNISNVDFQSVETQENDFNFFEGKKFSGYKKEMKVIENLNCNLDDPLKITLKAENQNYPYFDKKDQKSFYKREIKNFNIDHSEGFRNQDLIESNGNDSTFKESLSQTQLHICNIPNDKSTSKETFIVHKESHFKERNYQCAHCDYFSMRKTTLKKHLFALHPQECNTLHEEERKFYTCSLCEVKYKNRYSLLRHNRERHDQKKYTKLQCSFCEFTTLKKFILGNHIQTHNGETSFNCTLCTKSYKRKDLLSKHIFNAHSKKSVFKCKTCEKEYATEMGLQKHLEKGHKLSNFLPAYCPNTFKCPFPLCKKMFPHRCRLRCHILYHTKEHPFKCSLCGRGFFAHTDLKYHVYKHTKEKVFKCPLCDFMTNDQPSLQKHKRNSPSCRQLFLFHCEHCEYVCNRRIYMEKHAKKHLKK